MFALEIVFHDGISPSEVVFVRRPQAIIGNSDFAHVVIEGGGSDLSEIRLTRGLGREFYCHAVRRGERAVRPAFVEGAYSFFGEFDLGGVTTRITSLDADLQVPPEESPDQAAVRVLRQALRKPAPLFPAAVVCGNVPLVVSFQEDSSILIGRSRKCGLRIDSADVSSEHARMGYQDGQFWIEDLESGNGTFLGSLEGERISGRRELGHLERVALGSEIVLVGVSSRDDVSALNLPVGTDDDLLTAPRKSYPAVLSNSDLVKPVSFTFNPGSRVTVGRDPASDIWVSAAHVSRTHAELRLLDDGDVEVVDVSTNGIMYNGQRLPANSPLRISHQLAVLDLNAGVKLGICFSAADEESFRLGGESRKARGAEPEAWEKAPEPARDRGFEPVSRDSGFKRPEVGAIPAANDETFGQPRASFDAEGDASGEDGAFDPDRTAFGIPEMNAEPFQPQTSEVRPWETPASASGEAREKIGFAFGGAGIGDAAAGRGGKMNSAPFYLALAILGMLLLFAIFGL